MKGTNGGRTRFLGVVVPSLYLQLEGIDAIMDTLSRVNATAICIEPTVAAIVEDAADGARFPDLHVDGFQRVLDRALLGERELHVRRFLGYEPNLSFYGGGYRPLPPPGSADHVPVPGVLGATLAAAADCGLEAHVQLSPLTPPALHDDDLSVRVDGAVIGGGRVSNTGCVNNPALELYGQGLMRDLLEQHEAVRGLILDWVEFPAYAISEAFACFCPHCERRAQSAGVDWSRVREDVSRMWEALHNLDSPGAARARRAVGSPSALVELLGEYPGVLELLRFKAASVARFYRVMAETLRSLGRQRPTLSARGWAPPWNRISGTSYRDLAPACDVVAPKLFSFDYAALPRWYGEPLCDWNPRLAEGEAVELLLALFDLVRLPGKERLAAYQIPPPDEEHPLDAAGIERRVTEVVDQVPPEVRVRPITHAYGPLDQWERVVSTMRDLPVDGMWVQMYGYLSDEKLAVLEETWR